MEIRSIFKLYLLKNTCKKLAGVGILFIVSFGANAQRVKHVYESGGLKVIYQSIDGRWDGKYVSYYSNGQKKSEGRTENNYRIGNWTVWDSLGRIREQRTYINPFVYESEVYNKTGNSVRKPADTSTYALRYNTDGYIEYFPLNSPGIIMDSKRIWRSVYAQENPFLFTTNNLFTILKKIIIEKKVKLYSANDEVFEKELNRRTLKDDFTCVGLKLKEDWFYDSVRKVSETRIIGICPMVVGAQRKDTVDLCWFYYQDIRKYLALEKVNVQKQYPSIKTLEDVFFFRNFCGVITKESNVFDKSIQKESIIKETQRIEIGLFEKEHDLWIEATNKNFR